MPKRWKTTGRPKTLGDVTEYGEARQVAIIVGQNKGRKPENRSGACRSLPGKIKVGAVDQAFIEVRADQVGSENVGATRNTGRGWYEGKPEASVAYTVAYVPNDREPTFADFRKNMDELAEQMAKALCQDSVLVVRDDGFERTVAGATRRR